jgi:hypothetical protein
VGRLAIGAPLREWQARDERQPPGGQRGLSVRGEEGQQSRLGQQAIPFIGHA